MKYPQPVAFTAHDGQEQSVVIFATSSIAARRMGANQMDIEFDSVDFCRRSAEFDQYAPGPVPLMALVESGWWQECYGCGIRIDLDAITDEELEPVENTRGLFCRQSCQDRDAKQKAEEARVRKVAVERLAARVMKTWPEAKIANTHAFATTRGGHTVPQQVIVDFTFPGSQYTATYRYDKFREPPKLFVCNGDLAAWEAYVAARATS